MPRPVAKPATGVFLWEGKIVFRRVQTHYDRDTRRAYVELRAPDSDDGEIIVTAIFTYGTTQSLTKRRHRERGQAESGVRFRRRRRG